MQTVTIGGQTHDILFDANVLCKIQQRYGSVDVLGDKMMDIGEVLWILIQAINEAKDYKRIILRQTVEEEPVTEQQLGMLLDFHDLFRNSKLSQAIITAFNEGMGGRKN